MIYEGDPAGDGYFDFSARAGAAPNMELRANSIRSLPHSGESPVSIPPRSQDLRIDSAAVVAHQNTQLAG